MIKDLEKNLSSLEQIVEKLEQGETPLEESLKLFEQGIKLTHKCQTTLTQAEQKIEDMAIINSNNEPEGHA